MFFFNGEFKWRYILQLLSQLTLSRSQAEITQSHALLSDILEDQKTMKDQILQKSSLDLCEI